MKKNPLMIIVLLFGLGLLSSILVLFLWPDGEDTEPAIHSISDPFHSQTVPVDHDDATRVIIPPEAADVLIEEGGDPDLPEFESLSVLGWKIWGKVVTPNGNPISGAQVMLEYTDTPYEWVQALDAVFTDDRGRYVITHEAVEQVLKLPSIFNLPMRIGGRASAPGFLADYGSDIYLPHPSISDRPLRMDFVLEPGNCVVGFVVNVCGEPVRDAEVYLQGLEGTYENRDQAGLNGFFSIRTDVDVVAFCTIQAVKIGVGVSVPQDVEVAPGMPPAPLKVILREFGTIEGIAVTPHGRPLSGMNIDAYPVQLLKDSDDELWAYKNDLEYDTEEFLDEADHDDMTGLPWGTARTGPDGRFLISGLQPGSYFLAAPDDEFLFERNAEGVPRVLCITGERGVRITFPLYRLKIILRDEEGVLVPWASVHCDSPWYGIHGKGIYGGVGTVAITPGQVQISATARGGLAGKKELFVSRSSFENEVEIVLHPAGLTGCILFSFMDEYGKGIGDLDTFTLHLSGRMYGSLSKQRSDMERKDTGEYFVPVYADSYGLLVKAAGPNNMYCPVRMKYIRVKQGQEVALDLIMREGGRLHLTISPTPGKTRSPIDAITLFRLDEQDSKRNSLSLIMDEDLWHQGRCRYRLPYSLYDEVLEPGTYKIHVHLKGYARAEQMFTIERGKVTALVINLTQG